MKKIIKTRQQKAKYNKLEKEFRNYWKNRLKLKSPITIFELELYKDDLKKLKKI